MKRLDNGFRASLVFCLLLALAVLAINLSAAESLEGWTMVFNDEFTQTDLNLSKWSQRMDYAGIIGPCYHNTYYQSYSQDENAWIYGGVLHLRTHREAVEGDEPSGLYPYSQAIVVSRYPFTYGRLDVRARFPRGSGLWPCIWLMPEDKALWPPEIDIAEYYGIQKKMHHGLCYGEMKDPKWDSDGDSQTDFSQWHVYSLVRGKGYLSWWVDGVICKEIRAIYVPDIPMRLILENSVGSKDSAAGAPDAETVFPNDLEINYVRIYVNSGDLGEPLLVSKP